MKFTMPVTEAIRAFGAVSLASSKGAKRPHIEGVYVRVSGDTLNLVGTNGHWIALWCCTLEGQKFKDEGARFTNEAVDQILSDLTIIKRRWKLDVDEEAITFDTKAKSYTHRLGIMVLEMDPEDDGGVFDYPNYEKVIPKKRKTPTSPGFVGVNPSVFNPAFKAFVKSGYKGGIHFELGSSSLDPVILTADKDDHELTCVVMPMRGGKEKWSPYARPKLMLSARPEKPEPKTRLTKTRTKPTKATKRPRKR